jgi:hypothetical protein
VWAWRRRRGAASPASPPPCDVLSAGRHARPGRGRTMSHCRPEIGPARVCRLVLFGARSLYQRRGAHVTRMVVCPEGHTLDSIGTPEQRATAREGRARARSDKRVGPTTQGTGTAGQSGSRLRSRGTPEPPTTRSGQAGGSANGNARRRAARAAEPGHITGSGVHHCAITDGPNGPGAQHGTTRRAGRTSAGPSGERPSLATGPSYYP